MAVRRLNTKAVRRRQNIRLAAGRAADLKGKGEQPVATLRIPRDALVVLVGAPGSGKTTFANRHFEQAEVISSDYYRKVLSGSAANQEVSPEAFAMLQWVAQSRIDRGLLTVLDTI